MSKFMLDINDMDKFCHLFKPFLDCDDVDRFAYEYATIEVKIFASKECIESLQKRFDPLFLLTFEKCNFRNGYSISLRFQDLFHLKLSDLMQAYCLQLSANNNIYEDIVFLLTLTSVLKDFGVPTDVIHSRSSIDLEPDAFIKKVLSLALKGST